MIAAAGPAPPAPPVVPKAAIKRPAVASLPGQSSAKKQGLDEKLLITPVMTQAIFRDEKDREKLTVVITMPANITHKSQLRVEFTGNSNGGRLIVWVPRGGLSNNMVLLNKGYARMPGLTQKAADQAQFALEAELMDRREKKKDIIHDPYGIILKRAVDPHKTPMYSVYKTDADGDTVCCIVMEIPALKNAYDEDEIGSDAAEYLNLDD
jgi:hypothetical protein